jgi:hypothetical protein
MGEDDRAIALDMLIEPNAGSSLGQHRLSRATSLPTASLTLRAQCRRCLRAEAAPGKVKGAPRDPAECEVRCRYHRGSGSVDATVRVPRPEMVGAASCEVGHVTQRKVMPKSSLSRPPPKPQPSATTYKKLDRRGWAPHSRRSSSLSAAHLD